jgi:hypothetical protein
MKIYEHFCNAWNLLAIMLRMAANNLVASHIQAVAPSVF